ncbi:LytTR family DNA-binding domain-containing protein [Paracrocinitomix mangrovi]|uniref:LytR/AlgR family response regulator transcription factor n=1 Tax=Paracrocinitomix mangrovi TaxID=2862509 RepID=UPI001C8DDA8C|nr:LytTR family DNA-binding domain-containing protein [Paracrocinitomix mangrovi]UKN00257.1 LytTR family DNA-binding domain-containing protein [Paracrocinitomix mangrovi]
MSLLKAVIVEDEEIGRETLRNYLANYCKDVEVCGEGTNIQEGEELITKYQPDIVFLDIEMPFGNGFDLLEKLDEINFEVVFITAYSNYAIKALNLSAAYYILKPIDIDELIAAVEKIKSNSGNKERFQNTQILADNIKSINDREQKIVLPQIDGFEVVKIKNIIRAEAADNYTILYLEDGIKYTLSKTLKHYEELLSDFGFLRSHKSHLINLEHVVKYKKGKVGVASMTDGSAALISANAKKTLMDYFASSK